MLFAGMPPRTWWQPRRTPHGGVLYAPQEASVFAEEPQVVDGMFAVSQGPGLDLEIDLDVLSRYRVG